MQQFSRPPQIKYLTNFINIILNIFTFLQELSISSIGMIPSVEENSMSSNGRPCVFAILIAGLYEGKEPHVKPLVRIRVRVIKMFSFCAFVSFSVIFRKLIVRVIDLTFSGADGFPPR